MWDGGWTKIPLLFGSQEASSKEQLCIPPEGESDQVPLI